MRQLLAQRSLSKQREMKRKGKGYDTRRIGKEREVSCANYWLDHHYLFHTRVAPSTWVLSCTVLILGQWRLKCKVMKGKGKGKAREG